MSTARDLFPDLVNRARGLAPFEADLRVGERAEFPKGRDFAYCRAEPDGHFLIVVAPDFDDQPAGRIEGLLMHEIGHAVLFAAGVNDHTEREADEIAEALFGCTIAYDDDDVQTTGPGRRPRPAHLPT